MNRKKSIKVRTTMADYSKIKPIASKVGTSYYLKLCDDNGKSSLDYEYEVLEKRFREMAFLTKGLKISIEDKRYFEREAYSFFSVKYIISLIKGKIASQRGGKKVIYVLVNGNRFIKNIFDESRGYSTIPMQLVRSLGIKRGYNYKYRRKIFEILYSRMFFKGIERMFNEDKVTQRKYFKEYLLYIYFHKVNTFLGDATFSKFLNAFDMKYNRKNEKDIYDCTNEGIFIACMG